VFQSEKQGNQNGRNGKTNFHIKKNDDGMYGEKKRSETQRIESEVEKDFQHEKQDVRWYVEYHHK